MRVFWHVPDTCFGVRTCGMCLLSMRSLLILTALISVAGCRCDPPMTTPGLGEIGFVGRWRPGRPFLDGQPTVRLDQVHGNHVEEVATPGVVKACDGARTRAPGLMLTVRTADCVPALLTSAEGKKGIDILRGIIASLR